MFDDELQTHCKEQASRALMLHHEYDPRQSPSQTYALIQILRLRLKLICIAHVMNICDTLHQNVTAGRLLRIVVEVSSSESGSEPDEEHL